MSMPAGAIKAWIQDDINEHDNNTYGPIILRAITRAVSEVLGEQFWPDTIRIFEPTAAVAATSAQPIVLPANIKRIKSISDDNYTYYLNESMGRHPQHPYNYYFAVPLATPLDSGTNGLSVSQNEKSVTLEGDTFDASSAGEYIRIGASISLYKISTRDSDARLTLTEYFRGENQENVSWQIRPVGTPRIYLSDSENTTIAPSGTLRIEYQESPLEVTSDEHVIMLPDEACQAVYVRALQLSMERKGWSRAAAMKDGKYNHNIGLAKRTLPSERKSLSPKSIFRRARNQDILRNINNV